MAEFKDMLKYLRERENLSQKQLADKLNISASTISMYEVGSRQPNFETEEAIADFFNVDLNTLRGKPVPTYSEELEAFMNEVASGLIDPAEIDRAIEMYHKYQQVTPKVQSMVDYLLQEAHDSKSNQ